MKTTSRKITIAQFHDVFLRKSETFIYMYITHLRRFHPICLALRFINLDVFPIPRTDLYNLSVKPYSFKWFYYGVFKKLLCIDYLCDILLKHRKVEIIHAHFGPNGYDALRLKERLKVPLITTFYGGYDISEMVNTPQWKQQYSELFSRGDLFLVEGQEMKLLLWNMGCPLEKIRIQRIGIPIRNISFSERQPKQDGEPVVFLFCGRFVEKKGIMQALTAFKKVREKNTDFIFQIVGDGPMSEEIEKFIGDNNMSSYVILLGFLDYAEYLQRMSQADVFISPSIVASDGDSEGGAPTTILEAQASGMPVISTYHADIPNVVVPGKSALLSAEGNIEKLAHNIEYMINEQTQWADMGRHGRQFVEQYHDIFRELAHLEEVYESMIDANSKVTTV